MHRGIFASLLSLVFLFTSGDGSAALLFRNKTDLLMRDLESNEDDIIYSGFTIPVAIDYDFEKQLIFCTDASNTSIYRIDLQIKSSDESFSNDSAVHAVVNDGIMRSEGVAVDWIHDNLYWTDAERNCIKVSTLEGKFIKLLFEENISRPRAIVVNPLEGWIFWSDWGRQPTIERAGMDGSHRSIIVSENLLFPNGLTIDFVTRKIFWMDARVHNLCSAGYDGSNVKVILSSADVIKRPFSLDVFEDWLYFSDWGTRSINKIDKFSGTNLQTVVQDIHAPMGVKVYHRNKQPTGVNYCGPRNGNCSHLCLPAPHITTESTKFTCACPDGMFLVTEQTCI